MRRQCVWNEAGHRSQQISRPPGRRDGLKKWFLRFFWARFQQRPTLRTREAPVGVDVRRLTGLAARVGAVFGTDHLRRRQLDAAGAQAHLACHVAAKKTGFDRSVSNFRPSSANSFQILSALDHLQPLLLRVPAESSLCRS